LQAAFRRSVPVKLIAISLALLSAACASSRSGRERAALDEGIASFIAGDFATAEKQLREAIDSSSQEAEELRASAYLYLGRCYLETGRYQDATNAFTQGRLYGDVERFNEYLEEVARRIGAGSDAMGREARVTRAQLAVQLDTLFLGPNGEASVTTSVPGDVERHWAVDAISRVLAAGLMVTLPDGGFHPDEYVTRPAFWVTTRRVARHFAVATRGGGYAQAAAGNQTYVSGADAVTALQQLADEAAARRQR